jgi:23S rRNA (guanosine2251-2'-O)-methyltransferase
MKHTADLNEFTIKSSSGALLKMNIARANTLTETIEFLKSSGIQVIGASERSKESIDQADLDLPTAIIMGSEDEGISAAIVKDVDKFYKIPRQGTIDSLNVSSAAAVFFYEVQRQRSVTK